MITYSAYFWHGFNVGSFPRLDAIPPSWYRNPYQINTLEYKNWQYGFETARNGKSALLH